MPVQSPEFFIAAVVFVVVTFFLAWVRRNKERTAHKPGPPPKPAPVPAPVVLPPETFLVRLQRLGGVLAPLAEKSAHPRELAQMP
ncbi:MAG TPA: hypothetical protein VF213_00805, partial [Dongiaceae bacterium]